MKTKLLAKIMLTYMIIFFFIENHAQQPGKTYYIQSAIGEKYLDLSWARTQNGTPMQLWQYHGKNNQKFILEDAGNGYFYIKSVLGKYIHVQNRSNQAKALALIWDGKGNDNTKWKFKTADNGYHYIQSKKGTYLDVQWAKNTDGTPIWMWDFNGGDAQKWKLIAVYENNQTTSINSIPKDIPKKVEIVAGKAENKTKTDEVVAENIDDPKNNQYCSYRRISLDQSPDEDIGLLVTNGDESNVFPGAIYKSDAFITGSMSQPKLKQKDYNISIDFTAEGSKETGTMIECDEDGKVSKASVNNAISDLIRANKDVENSGSFAYTLHKVESQEELDIAIYGGYTGFGVNIQADFKYNKKSKRNMYVARFYQKYYTVSVDSEHINENDRKKIKGDDLYISDVTYGRIGFIRIESKFDEEDIRLALDFAYEGGGSKVNLGGDGSYNNIKREMRFRAVALGGHHRPFVSAEGFFNWVNNSKWNPKRDATPIGYKLRFLHNDQVADVRTTGSTVVPKCRPYKSTRITFMGMYPKGRHDHDCDRIGHKVYVTMQEVDHKGNVIKTFNGVHESEEKGSYLLLCESWEKTGNGPGGPKFAHRNDLLLWGAAVNETTRKTFNKGEFENRSEHPFIDYRLDLKAVEENRIYVKINHVVSACHKDGGFPHGNWRCNIKTENNGKPIRRKLKSDILTFRDDDGEKNQAEEVLFEIPVYTNDPSHSYGFFYKIKM